VQFWDPDGRCSAPAGLKEGQVGVCVEQFIADKYVGPKALGGLGDFRQFSGNDHDDALTARVRVKLIVDPDQGDIVGVDSHVGESEALWGAWARQGHLEARLHSELQLEDGTLAFTLETHALNGFAEFPEGPKEAIDMRLNLHITPEGKGEIAPGSMRDGFPSYGVYLYKIVNGRLQTTTLHEGYETTIDKLAPPMDTKMPSSCPGNHGGASSSSASTPPPTKK
jgi:hypothetical protein